MAERGFVALSVAYDNTPIAWLSDHQNQLRCLFTAPSGLLTAACALPQVDCDLGIATWGHSQGGLVAARAFDFDARVRAVWITGVGADGRGTLPVTRLRAVHGEADTGAASASALTALTGLDPAKCSDPHVCLRADGSGFVIVQRRELASPAESTADHSRLAEVHAVVMGGLG
jgi:hypothetical protein